jgi:hypothetical protein
MDVNPTTADWQKAAEVHRLFSAKPNSKHIASEFALAHLAAVLRTQKIRTVLEFGAGIGTVTYLLLSSRPDSEVECTERNELCLAALSQNLAAGMRERLTIYSDGSVPERPFDLIVIDGKVSGGGYAREGTICFAEGNRANSRSKLEAALNSQGFTCTYVEYRRPVTIRWRTTRFGFPIPHISNKGCWIGSVESTRDFAANLRTAR